MSGILRLSGRALLLACVLLVPVAGIAKSGGPDGFGYGFVDCTERAGPVYAWQGITRTGTPLDLDNNGEADTETTVFEYSFYGERYDIFRLGNNGGVLVGPTTISTDDISANNQELPQVTHPIPAIFPFWDDLDDDAGDVLWEEFATCPHPHGIDPCMIFEWNNRPHSFNIGSASFQAILFANGDVIFQYADTDFGDPKFDRGASATVGIEDDGQDMSYFVQYSFMRAEVPSSFAILFTDMIFRDGFEADDRQPCRSRRR